MNIQDYLSQMRRNQSQKGTIGELAVMKVCEKFLNIVGGGFIAQSYTYKTHALPGNIKRSGSGYRVESLGGKTEIDIVCITRRHIYCIEVKSYRAGTISIHEDGGIQGAAHNDKSPVHQHEMHMRHLYQNIAGALPNGSTQHITPIVCFVDKATINDLRSDEDDEYIKVTIINSLLKTMLDIESKISGEIIDYDMVVDNFKRNNLGIDKVIEV